MLTKAPDLTASISSSNAAKTRTIGEETTTRILRSVAFVASLEKNGRSYQGIEYALARALLALPIIPNFT